MMASFLVNSGANDAKEQVKKAVKTGLTKPEDSKALKRIAL
jgi:hypothetical protein